MALPRRSTPTSSEVAKRAGVSRTTVSFVLNDLRTKGISEETRQKVLQAASEVPRENLGPPDIQGVNELADDRAWVRHGGLGADSVPVGCVAQDLTPGDD